MIVGLFGGSFNPIHFGHLNLALEIKEKKGLNQVWFIPALSSPLRKNDEWVAPHHRLKMVELALAGLGDCDVCSIELERPPPSYMIDTIMALTERHPTIDFSLVCGEDSLLHFDRWKEPQEIVRRIPILIGSRLPSQLLTQLPSLPFNEEMQEAICKGIVPTRQMEISSTEIRERLKKKLYCGHLLPGKVLDYIYENQLYSSSSFVKK